MLRLSCLFVFSFALIVVAAEPEPAANASPAQPDTAQYEFLVIQAKPGKTDRLHAWFRQHQDDVLAKHGATSLAYLVPVGENPERKLLCLYRYPSLSAATHFSRAVKADPAWAPLDASQSSPEVLIEKIDTMRMTATNFSPAFTPEKSAQPRVFELRTYTCPSPAKLAALHERFRNHTMKLFAKHGMHNLIYWQPQEIENSDRKLVYLLAHKSQDAAKESFAAFRSDPDWLAAKKESEARAGGSLTNAEHGVLSEFFIATDYSPLN